MAPLWPPAWEAVAAEFQQLPEGLRRHCQRVSLKAQALARRFGADPEKARLAALAHDLARTLSDDEFLARARRYGLPVGPEEERFPLLLHAPLGAERLRELGIADPEILEAARYHTAGKPGLGLLARVVFLADKLEAEKARGVPVLERAARQARRGLDRAILTFLDWQLAELEKQGTPRHPDGLAFRDHLRRSLGQGHPRRADLA